MPVSRRQLLLGALCVSAAAGCSRWVPTEQVQRRAAARVLAKQLELEHRVIAAYMQLRDAGDPNFGPKAAALLAEHEEHAQALLARLPRGHRVTTPTVGPGFDAVVDAETRSAQHALTEVRARGVGDISELLSSIAASENTHLVALGKQVDLPILNFTDAPKEALKALAAAEHAAIFAYGAIGAHLIGETLELARTAEALHRERREALLAALDAPEPAPLDYQMPAGQTAIELAIGVEQRCAAQWRQAATTLGQTGCVGLTGSSLLAAGWRRAANPQQYGTVAFPGL
ncbi:MAG: DUF4439 domain-containing protein [Corynebacteriales bacterium]|nr:DUF4439 domain-containing protein [Mycobacteriales bacterium]